MSGCVGDCGTIKENEFMKCPFGNSQTRLVFRKAITNHIHYTIST